MEILCGTSNVNANSCSFSHQRFFFTCFASGLVHNLSTNNKMWWIILHDSWSLVFWEELHSVLSQPPRVMPLCEQAHSVFLVGRRVHKRDLRKRQSSRHESWGPAPRSEAIWNLSASPAENQQARKMHEHSPHLDQRWVKQQSPAQLPITDPKANDNCDNKAIGFDGICHTVIENQHSPM